MDRLMLASFVDELQKIGAMTSNVMTSSISKGSNTVTKPVFPKPGISKSKDLTTKPTNYSIVNTEDQPAAFGTAASASKTVPPPPVRT